MHMTEVFNLVFAPNPSLKEFNAMREKNSVWDKNFSHFLNLL